MAQHDYVIDNASGATVRADINSALSAIQTLNSGTSAPSSTAAGMLWLDTTGGAPYVLKLRDAGNNHWLTLGNVTDPGADGNLELLPGKINLPSSGGIYESDGSTEILTESSGSVTLKNTTLNANNTFPTGHVIQTKTDTFDPTASQDATTTADDILGTNLQVTITPNSTSNKLIVTCFIGNIYTYANANRSLIGGFKYHSDWSGTPTTLGSREFVTNQHLRHSDSNTNMANFYFQTIADAPVATEIIIRPWFKTHLGNVQLFNGATSNQANLTVMEIQA